MDWRQRHLMGEAIMLFEGDEVIVELRYDDFRARLLNGQAISPFKRETARGAYVAVGDGLMVEALCFFLIDFDAAGVPPADWNVPVRELAHTSGAGPNLGAGPVQLAGRGQCSIPWHNLRLWMPDLEAEDGACHKVQDAVRGNGLGFRAVRPKTLSETFAEHARVHVDRRPSGQRGSTLAARLGVAPSASLSPETPRAVRMQSQSLNTLTEQAERAVQRAEQQFEDRFSGRGSLSDGQLQTARSRGAAVAQLRSAHAAELARMRSVHERTVGSLKTEIQRLRRDLERLNLRMAITDED